MNRNLVLKPRLSEKAYALSEERNTYVFDTIGAANSNEVTIAVKKQYEVEPKAVRLAGVRGKNQRSVRRGRTVRRYQRSDIRKAYVTLKDGDKLPIFDAVEEASKKPETKEKK